MKVHSLLTPTNCVLVLIDFQPQMLFGVRSIDPGLLINNVVGLAKSAKLFKSPPFSGWQPFFPDIYYENVKNKRSSRWYPFFSQHNAIHPWISYEKREYNFSDRPILSEYLHLLSCKSPMNYNVMSRKFVYNLINHFERFLLTNDIIPKNNFIEKFTFYR